MTTSKRAVITTGKDLFVGSDKHVEAEARRLAKNRGCNPDSAVRNLTDWRSLYPPASSHFLAEYESVRDKYVREEGDAYIFDLEQKLQHAPVPGFMIPTLVTHGPQRQVHCTTMYDIVRRTVCCCYFACGVQSQACHNA